MAWPGSRRTRAILLLAAVLPLAGCSGRGDPATAGVPGPVAAGVWGSDVANLTVEAARATLVNSCAEGVVGGPLVADADGRFELPGMYGRVGGAPPPDGVFPREPAMFRGRVTGSTMSLTIHLTGPGTDVGPYLLTLGRRGEIILCP